MYCVFHDNNLHLRFAPLSLTKPIGELRMGLYTNTERWRKMLGKTFEGEHRYGTEAYLKAKFPAFDEADDALHINASVIANVTLAKEVLSLKTGEKLCLENTWIAQKGKWNKTKTAITSKSKKTVILQHVWDLFLLNKLVLEADFNFAIKNRKSQIISPSNTVIGDVSQIFIEEGAQVEASILNAQAGPIYLAKNAEIMEGCMVRGGLALMEHATLKMGAKIYGATTIGPHCKVGGEVSNSIFQAYSNKGHDGFLGNSIIGAWCNLGADTNSSNLKNNYSSVRAYSYETNNFEQTALQFLGLIMGDHSKSGINTMFNTATVIGVSANVFGSGFPPKYIPSFSWGGHDDEKFVFEKACEVAANMMKRRSLIFNDCDWSILKHLFNY